MKYTSRFLITFLATIILACSQSPQENNRGEDEAYQEATALPSWYNPSAMDTLSVVTWNIEHFVDQHDNPYIQNERENKPPQDMEQRRELLAKAIKNLDADIVVFQEIESDSYLRTFAEEYFPDMGYEVFASLESADWYMNVVMMSRVPLGLFHSYANINTPISGQTDEEGNPASQTFTNNRMWTADILVKPDYSFTLTGLHLKAGGGKRNQAWRLGQIRLLRKHFKMLTNQDPDQNMLVMGDLNTTPDSKEFNTLLGDQAPKFVDPLEGTNTFSHASDSLFCRIDHILPNQHMNRELVPNSVDVVEPLERSKMITISDHMPLQARFTTNEK
jgi:endonuclease/exonuclease/phosphatase family metal-dependent hydrolase